MIHILIANKSRLVCDSLRDILDRERDLYVVGCVTRVEELYFMLPHSHVVLLGPELEDAGAIDVLDNLHTSYPEIKIVMMELDERPEMILRFVEAGAAGYVLQNESVENAVHKVRATCEEKALVSPDIAALLIKRLAYLARLETSYLCPEMKVGLLKELTPREIEVLDLISQECTNQEIADRLVIECGTVKNHVHNILQKLEATSRQEAAVIYQKDPWPFGQASSNGVERMEVSR